MKNHVLDLIGDTPLVKIGNLSPNSAVDLLAKLEGCNPGGSVKDRIALKMIQEAEKKGVLDTDTTILEPTSGNTGIGLALVATVKGYDCLFTMPASVSKERVLLMKSFGASLILTPSEKGTDGAIEKAHELKTLHPDRYFMPNQFENPANVEAHYQGTGPEIWNDTGGELTHFVAGLGTSGTMMGVGRFLKEQKPSVQLIGVEPPPNHSIQGLKNMEESITPAIFDPSLLDRKITVSTKEACKWAWKLTTEEGIFVGQSSGAAMKAAVEVATELEEGLIVTIFPDFGFKYLTCKPYEKEIINKEIKKARAMGETVKI